MENARTSGNLSPRDRFGRKFATVDGAPPRRNDSGKTIRRKRKLSRNEMMVFRPGKKWLTRAEENIVGGHGCIFLKTSRLETEKRRRDATTVRIYYVHDIIILYV